MEKVKADYHVHSIYSIDSKEPLENHILEAIKKGMTHLCITDHVDYGIQSKEGELQVVDYGQYFDTINHLQTKYKNQINLKIGIEFGVQQHTISQYHMDASTYPFDFIIFSSHEIDNQEFWLYEFQEGKSQKQIYLEYYKNILHIIETFDDFDVIGHLDVIRRYDPYGKDYLDDDVIKIVTEIFNKLIKMDKGIEINASSYAYGHQDSMPSKQLLQLYYDLGGRIITYGSDAHCKDDLLRDYQRSIDVLKHIGFKHLYTFSNRKYTQHNM